LVLLDAQKRLINKTEEVKIKGGYQTRHKNKEESERKSKTVLSKSLGWDTRN